MSSVLVRVGEGSPKPSVRVPRSQASTRATVVEAVTRAISQNIYMRDCLENFRRWHKVLIAVLLFQQRCCRHEVAWILVFVLVCIQ